MDKWAFEPPVNKFTDLRDPWHTLGEFLDYCNITAPVGGQQEFGP